MGLNEFIFFAICFALMALVLIYRLISGPTAADRAMTADAMDILVDMAMILFALYSGRSIYVDVAFITAIFGFIVPLIASPASLGSSLST